MVGVLTGQDSETRLREAGADHVVDSVAQVPALVAAALA